jgi:replicative DNA helicase
MEKRPITAVTQKLGLKQGAQSPILSETGKLQPQAVDLEEAVLGAMMLEKNAINDAIDILTPDSFYKETHQKIYEAIQQLFSDSQPIDILTVTSKLRSNGFLELVGGPAYIASLTNRVASAANIEYHARIIQQKYIQRELIGIASTTIKDAFEDTADVFDLLDKTESGLYRITQGNIRKDYRKMHELIHEAIDEIEKAKKNTDGVSGVPTGFVDLDKVTSGWQKSDMIVIAARPAMGKTAFVLSMARNAAVQFDKPVAVFSLEMSAIQLVNRLISGETELTSDKLRKGNLQPHEYEQLHARIKKLSEAPLFIDDTPALSIFELRAKARRLKQQHGIEMIIIDYLQLMTAGGEGKGNREQEISNISRSIKQIAKELDIPIVALSQLSRSVETRGGDKKPMLSDLRESGAIEQDADIVGFIYRPEYYNITDLENVSTKGLAQILIAKHRNGALADVNLKFVAEFSRFENFDSGFAFKDEYSPMNPNHEFENNVSTLTVKSRMDDIKDEDNSSDYNFNVETGDDVPF